MKKKEEHKKGYKTLEFLLTPIFYIMYGKPKLYNKEVIPKEGPIIICGNHKHLMDQCLAIKSTKRMIHYMAKIEYFRNWKTAWFFKTVGCIPVNREIKDTASKECAISLLKEGYAIGIFPEGTRNKTDAILLPLKFGTVSMAQKTGATIVPFAITGDYKFRTKNLKLTYGTPFKVPEGMSLESANDKLTKEITRLLKENQ